MTLTRNAIAVYVIDNMFIGKTKQELEDEFRLMLQTKMIDLDDYSTAMEVIYGE